MENISRKLLFISKLYEFNNSYLKNCEELVNKLNTNNNVNKSINSMKMFRISFESEVRIDFNVNEGKQRQCYKQLKCFWPKCRYSCELKANFNNHVLLHSNKRQFVCEECNKQFKLQCNLIEHRISVHSTDKSFVCSTNNCNKKFQSKPYLIRHQRIHSTNKFYECDSCDKKFKTRRSLVLHRSYIHSNHRPFVCPRSDCNKQFKTELSLRIHQRSHSSINQFECDICQKGFKTKHGFRYHKNHFHSNDRPFECPQINCNKRFKTELNLQYHELTHSSKKSFGCDKCDKRFKTNKNLNNHKKRIHSDIRRHKCLHNNCNKTYSTLSQLKVHMIFKHSTERPYKCNYQQCQTSFKSKANLNQHRINVHRLN